MSTKTNERKDDIKAMKSSSSVVTTTIALCIFIVIMTSLFGLSSFIPKQFESYDILNPAFLKGVEAHDEVLKDNDPNEEKVEGAKEVEAEAKKEEVEEAKEVETEVKKEKVEEAQKAKAKKEKVEEADVKKKKVQEAKEVETKAKNEKVEKADTKKEKVEEAKKVETEVKKVEGAKEVETKPKKEKVEEAEAKKEEVEEAKKVEAKARTPFVRKKTLFTKEELKEYDGSHHGKGPFLAVLGQVFDVSRGKAYGPGGDYGFFSGVDGSRAFISGEFNEKGLIDEVSGLTHDDYLGLKGWEELYRKDYVYVGKVVGRFFDSKGRETPYARDVQHWISQAQTDKERRSEEEKRYPTCSTEYTESKGRRVWCNNKKAGGGVERDWVGRPRKLFYPGREVRCACIEEEGEDGVKGVGDVGDGVEGVGGIDGPPRVEEYEGCDPSATSCQSEKPKMKKEEL